MYKVLVVDDDKDLLEMVEITLTHQGFKISALDNGDSIFQQLDSFKPDIILLDIYLDGIDGRDVCRQLKTRANYQNIPVVLYSAGNINLASVSGSQADLFIKKPFDIKKLAEKIKKLLAA